MERRPGVPGLAIATVLLVAAARLDGQPSQTAIHPRDVLSVMERVADWQLANPSKHAPTDWTQGAGDAGFMALAGISGNPKYRDAMVAVGESNRWEPGPGSTMPTTTASGKPTPSSTCSSGNRR